jgi:Tfp pilus assembly protein FimT
MNFRERQRSFPLVIVVVAVVTTMVGLAVGMTMNAVSAAKSSNSTGALMSVLEVARNQATSQRRDFQLVFTAPNKIEVFRVEVPGNTTTLVQTAYLEMGQIYKRWTSMGDPGSFGHAGEIAFGSTPTIRFTSDGTLIDSSGEVLNGTLYLAINDKQDTARAVTIFGATGLVRSWSWNGTAWVN